MEKLSMKKFEKAQLNKTALQSLTGGKIVKTKWTGSSGGGGIDEHNTESGATKYDDGCYSNNGIIVACF